MTKEELIENIECEIKNSYDDACLSSRIVELLAKYIDSKELWDFLKAKRIVY